MFGGYELYINNGKKKVKVKTMDFIDRIQKLGVGEIVINSIDNDGVMEGYDFNLIDKVKASVKVPLTILGGAGSIDDIALAIQRYGIIGSAAGSLFVFKGKYKAVLINYLSGIDKDSLISEAGLSGCLKGRK